MVMGLAAKKKEEPLQITIDHFGRVVIPQEVRHRLGLRPGTRLEVAHETGDSIVLKAVAPKPYLKRINGVLVIAGTGKLNFDIVKAIKKDREDRIKHILGLDHEKNSV